MAAEPTGEHDPVAIYARGLRRLGYMVIALFALLVVVGTFAYLSAQSQRQRIARDEEATARRAAATAVAEARLLRAQCAFRRELRQRVAQDRVAVERASEFLRKNPNGIPGISAKLIARGIADQEKGLTNTRRAARALATLRCSTPKKRAR